MQVIFISGFENLVDKLYYFGNNCIMMDFYDILI